MFFYIKGTIFEIRWPKNNYFLCVFILINYPIEGSDPLFYQLIKGTIRLKRLRNSIQLRSPLVNIPRVWATIIRFESNNHQFNYMCLYYYIHVYHIKCFTAHLFLTDSIGLIANTDYHPPRKFAFLDKKCKSLLWSPISPAVRSNNEAKCASEIYKILCI